MGEKHENGNWFPHTHFQLVLLEPAIADCPGVSGYCVATVQVIFSPAVCKQQGVEASVNCSSGLSHRCTGLSFLCNIHRCAAQLGVGLLE